MNDAVRRVSPREAHELVTRAGYTYLDVRHRDDFADGHPPGALNVPFDPAAASAAAAFVEAVAARLPRTAKLVVGCRVGVRSLGAARALLAAGFAEVVDQRAGWEGARDAFGRVVERGWKSEGLPVEE